MVEDPAAVTTEAEEDVAHMVTDVTTIVTTAMELQQPSRHRPHMVLFLPQQQVTNTSSETTLQTQTKFIIIGKCVILVDGTLKMATTSLLAIIVNLVIKLDVRVKMHSNTSLLATKSAKGECIKLTCPHSKLDG